MVICQCHIYEKFYADMNGHQGQVSFINNCAYSVKVKALFLGIRYYIWLADIHVWQIVANDKPTWESSTRGLSNWNK